jgi:hypothetical protein
LIFIALALPAAIGFLAARGRPWLLRLAIACCAPMAVGGTLFSLGLYLDRPILVDVAGELLLLALVARRGPAVPLRWPRGLLLWATGALVAVAVVRFAAHTQALPHGAWDAWAIWNLKARFIARAPGDWRRFFEVPWCHPDYPLLVPAAIGRTWRLSGESTLAPALHGLLFAAGATLFVAAAVARERGPEAACVAVCFLCLGPLPVYAATQYADVPLSCFAAGAVALLLHDEPLLAGLAAGCAAWTKNEGLWFALMLALVTLAWRRGKLPHLLAGIAPFLALQAWHKHLAPTDDYRQWWTLRAALADVSSWPRVRASTVAFARLIGYFEWPLLLPLAIARRRISPSLYLPLATAAAMLAGSWLALTTTPLPLAEHLQTTADRLVMQAHPLLVMAAFLVSERRS